MVQEITYSLNTSDTPTTEISLNSLRTLLGQVEADLYRSEVYEKVIGGLRTLPEEVNTQVQRMVKAVSREAIRLALCKLVTKQNREIEPSLSSVVDSTELSQAKLTKPAVPPPPAPNAALCHSIEAEELSATAVAATIAADVSPNHQDCHQPHVANSIAPSSSKPAKDKPSKRLSKKELAAQSALQAWEDRLREIGQELRQTREAKSLSSYHVHLKTQIPVHLLEALETGRLDRLPEDIYIRGFICRMGQALGLDGVSLAASLPTIDPVKAILPTWYKPQLKAGLQLQSVHLYVGYAALMAGGLTWLAQQAPPKQTVQPSLIPEATLSPTPQSTTPDNSSTTGTSKAVTQKSGTVAPVGIAPPEMHPF